MKMSSGVVSFNAYILVGNYMGSFDGLTIFQGLLQISWLPLKCFSFVSFPVIVFNNHKFRAVLAASF